MEQWIIDRESKEEAKTSLKSHSEALKKWPKFEADVSKNPFYNPKHVVQYYNYYIQTVVNTSFSIGYVSGVQAMMIGTNTFSPVASDSISLPNAWVEPEDMAFEEAKKKVEQYFLDHHGDEIDYVDLMDALNIHLPLIVDACDELESEGKIAGVN